jgi:uncharacterized protein
VVPIHTLDQRRGTCEIARNSDPLRAVFASNRDPSALCVSVSPYGPGRPGRGLSDLDGFLTGIVVGPELILPSEWLPVIWGGEEPEFETEAEKRIVLGTIMGRYNEITGCLNSEPENFEPIFMEGPEEEVIASDWASGFLDAISLRPKAWEPLIAHDRAGIMIMPILLLTGDAEIYAGPDSAVDEEVFLAEVPDIIPACVAGIHEFWKSSGTYRQPLSRRDRTSPGSRRRH